MKNIKFLLLAVMACCAFSSQIMLLEATHEAEVGKTATIILDAINADGDAADIALLIAKGADVDAIDKYGETALIGAAIRNNTKIVAQLLAARANLEIENNNTRTALMEAVMWSKEEIVVQLLAAGANVNFESAGYCCSTPLYWAASRGSQSIVAHLLNAGAKIEAQTEDGMTALMAAASECNQAVVAKLLAAGANVNAEMSSVDSDTDEIYPNGKTALYWAYHSNPRIYEKISDEKINVFTQLLAAGAKIPHTIPRDAPVIISAKEKLDAICTAKAIAPVQITYSVYKPRRLARGPIATDIEIKEAEAYLAAKIADRMAKLKIAFDAVPD